MTIILFLLTAVVLMLITIPFVMLVAEVEGIWENIKFWAVVAAIWAAVWFVLSWRN